MDIKPQWIVPRSIIEKEVARHAGNVGYFERQRMFVRHLRSGKKIQPQHITWGMLHSKDYTVVQEGGEGNSLGRIIFRFDNNFSVFLHDTSSKAFFSRDNRGVSHGCVRVERPLELAIFLLDDKDEDTIEKLRYSMTVRLSQKHIANDGNDDEDEEGDDGIDRSKLISTLDVGPHVPIFITYYTLYPNAEGELREYPDVYGYDRVVYQNLKHYVE
jgi:murein L,D-transpeptidase YcbB/YkuD